MSCSKHTGNISEKNIINTAHTSIHPFDFENLCILKTSVSFVYLSFTLMSSTAVLMPLYLGKLAEEEAVGNQIVPEEEEAACNQTVPEEE